MSTTNTNDNKPEEVKSSEEAGQDKDKGGYKKRIHENNYGTVSYTHLTLPTKA